ncbi:hypothetical protein J1899_12895 [Cytobacillus gottheilii]|uniref:Uncharacterized protein n=2 Tax=Cytobacillus gottheilii TaxID=859144 RepID=A0ABX8FI96_9BACI|nr:hypothetical protein J1899_12895 [Cytobacillus gottheilii]
MMERKIYLILTDTGTIFTRLIKMYTRKPYNHASLSFDSHFLQVYSFGRKRQRNPFIGGFVKESVSKGLLQNASCAIYSCHVTEEQYQKMQEFISKIEMEKHRYRYNLLGVFALPFQKKINRSHAFFCSQFVSTVLSEGNVVNLNKPACFVTPHDLQHSNPFQLVFQGRMSDFINVSEHHYQAALSDNHDWFGLLWRKIWSI